MKRKLFLFTVFISILFLSTNVDAQTISHTKSGTLGAWKSVSSSNADLIGDYYKYVRIELNVNIDSKFSVTMIGANNVSGLGGASAINYSPKLSISKNKTFILYILPRNGMSCPSDANYCFGSGSDLTKNTVVQGNECDGKMCSVYGVRLHNENKLKSFNYNMKYEFVK